MHTLLSHIHFFRWNLGDVSEEHIKCSREEIHVMDRMYQGPWDYAMMGDYVSGCHALAAPQSSSLCFPGCSEKLTGPNYL